MTPELSLRVTSLLPKIEQSLTIEQYWEFTDKLSAAKTWNDLDESTKNIIIGAEGGFDDDEED